MSTNLIIPFMGQLANAEMLQACALIITMKAHLDL